MHSKIKHIKTAYKLQINTKRTRCPICDDYLDLEQVDEEILCKCGYVYQTPYPYVAGKQINTNLNFHIKKMRTKKK